MAATLTSAPAAPETLGFLTHEITPIASDYARATIAEQYRHTIAQEAGVLADKDPEYLHQMRVGSRRLGSALLAFDCLIELPKPAREPRVRSLAKTLGALRDLDVQIAAIQTDYRPRVSKSERKVLDKTLKHLQHHRDRALTEVRRLLKRSRYRAFKHAYECWFEHPQCKPLAALPLALLLPELIEPLLCDLLLHPGWLVSMDSLLEDTPLPSKPGKILHDLRKVCKYVRYQAEIFSPFYSKPFHHWIRELKQLQDQLGDLQDSRILQHIVSDRPKLPELEAVICANQRASLGHWEDIRQRYLSATYRDRLHRMLLQPQAPYSHSD